MRRTLLYCLVGIVLGSNSFAGKPLCYLYGVMRSKTGKKAELTDMLRLHFDASNKASCIALINSYCRYNVRDQGYSPRDLQAFFKPDVDEDTKNTFKFSENCKVTADSDDN